ncbi:Patatin [Nitrobacter sp. Nb-311A]|uniref:patatin-like phospholipase family protein n=1 Tax=unclassified Nitrobacter TaxID=2620411 RepID=UPI00006865F4|nr:MULTISPECIES: patatin-like phospholipase family protein [unclassified Nitrobacter]EAQ36117.1 Patatin [Nitrobacter sp. Nb-311A]MCB1393872.1 cyclic nucleotide-binding domain-containing protein [Nitrobacter sp.]MCV0387458.1 cyclic nucleotide-binding domain-containing protein [Nitrobacter sp.]
MTPKPDPDLQQRDALLQTVLRDYFASDNAAILNTIRSQAEYVDLVSGAVLLRQGEAGDDVYFVLSGRLHAFSETESGARKILGEIGRGETIGELALFTGEPRSATIVAVRDTLLVKVTRAMIEHAILQHPEIEMSMMRVVIRRFRQRERERQTPLVPVNICILPVTPGPDAADFARRLRNAQAAMAGPVTVVTADDVVKRFGIAPDHAPEQHNDALAGYIDDIEAQSRAVYLVADGDDTAWTRFCLRHADEVLLLANADHDPGLAAVERACLSPAAPISIARQTLVLLHRTDTKIPVGTTHWLNARPNARHFHIRPQLPADMHRLARIVAGRGIGLVLSGGGARGFAHIGVIKALEEAGIPVDMLGGSSIGAVMGMVLALGRSADEVAAAVRKAFLQHPRGNVTGDYNFIPLVSLIKGARTRSAMTQAVRDATGRDAIDSEDCWTTFFTIASDFSTGSEAVLLRGDLTRNVGASYAIPGALPPVFIGRHMMYDGSTFNNFPVDVMARLGAGRIIGVDLSIDREQLFDIDCVPGTPTLLRDKLKPRAKRRYLLPSVPETMLRSSFITSISKQKEMGKFTDLLFRPRTPECRLLDWSRFDEMVAAGYSQARQVLAGLTDEQREMFR